MTGQPPLNRHYVGGDPKPHGGIREEKTVEDSTAAPGATTREEAGADNGRAEESSTAPTVEDNTPATGARTKEAAGADSGRAEESSRAPAAARAAGAAGPESSTTATTSTAEGARAAWHSAPTHHRRRIEAPHPPAADPTRSAQHPHRPGTQVVAAKGGASGGRRHHRHRMTPCSAAARTRRAANTSSSPGCRIKTRMEKGRFTRATAATVQAVEVPSSPRCQKCQSTETIAHYLIRSMGRAPERCDARWVGAPGPGIPGPTGTSRQ